jgi:hypothetical protein
MGIMVTVSAAGSKQYGTLVCEESAFLVQGQRHGLLFDFYSGESLDGCSESLINTLEVMDSMALVIPLVT